MASRTLGGGVDPVTTTVCPDNGLLVANVTLNLNGCVITGDGIDVTASTSTIRNNVVSGSETDGNVLRNGPASDDLNLVHAKRTDGTGGWGLTVRGTLNTVSSNVSLRSGAGGIDSGGNGGTIRQYRAERSAEDGLTIQGSRHVVTLDHSLRNAGNGYENLSRDTTFDRNRADYDDGSGFLDDSSQLATNTDVGNRPSGNAAGPSSPAALCR